MRSLHSHLLRSNRDIWLADRDKASKTGTVPAKTGRMVSLPNINEENVAVSDDFFLYV